MDGDHHPEREAEEAIRLAAAAVGLERQRWIDLAIAWQELARTYRRATATGSITAKFNPTKKSAC